MALYKPHESLILVLPFRNFSELKYSVLIRINLSRRKRKENFPVSCSIGISILLKFLLRGVVKSFDDQGRLYINPNYTSDLMGALDAMREVGLNSLSDKILNRTSTMDIDVDDI
ncbi:hypothetical protein Fot_24363 [Forsythia ovata]|uniref:Uncharacterized protein n=1 Tax=Forsythia ovata TaxID=205694 RepID=A0ABD1U5Z7_9LAMI